MNNKRVFTRLDRFRLGGLLGSRSARRLAALRVLDDLEFQLEQSRAVSSETVEQDVVTMNSTVRLVDLDGGDDRSCTVVYPEDVDLVDDGVSVLEPLGASLVGCETGDMIECEETNSRWRVEEILSQPEQHGALHL